MASVFEMVSGIGDSFADAYGSARKRKLEEEAPGLITNLMNAYQGGSAVPAVASAAPGADATSSVRAAPTFAATGGAMGDYLGTTRAKESGGDDTARNPNSTATGRYQFTEDTWNGLAKKYPALGLTANGRTDPAQQERAMQAFTRDNADALSRAGIPINPGNLYVSHFLGEAGGPKFIAGAMSNPDAPAVQFVSPGAARANRSIFFNADGSPKTAGAVYRERTSRYADAGPVATPTLPTATGGAPARAATSTVTLPDGSTAEYRPATDSAPGGLADMPATDAKPAGFQIPGQPASAAAAPAAQGFAGFGSPATRITPQMQSALTAAWRNPETRAFATQIYGNLLKGKESAWSLTTMGDQPVLFNQSTAQIIPVGQGKRQTATVGNGVIDTNTGQVIYQAPEKPQVVNGALVSSDGKVVYEGKDDKFTYQTMPGVGMVALHPTDPDKSRVIIAGQQPRPMTPEERTAYGLTADQPAGMGADGKPFGIGGGKTTVNVDTKGAGKFSEKANELQAKRYADMVDAADRAVPLRADIDTLSNFAAQINTGRLAEARLGLAQYANDVGLTPIANSLTGGKMGEMEAFSALVDKLTPQMRVPGSGATSDREGASFKNSLPSLLKSPGGNAIIADTFRGLADYQSATGEIAGKALRGEMSQAEADQAIRALPSPYARFREYQGAQKGGQPGAPTVAKGADRTPLPDGYSAARTIFEAKAAVKAGKDKAVIAERLRAYGIDPKRLDD